MPRNPLSGLSQATIEKINNGELCIHKYNRTHVLADHSAGVEIELNCKSWRCPRHRKHWLHKWRMVLMAETTVRPVDKIITLTCAGHATPQQLTRAKQLFFRYLRKYNGDIEYLCTLEFTSETRLPHLHILARSVYIDQALLSTFWRYSTVQAGIAESYVVWIEAPRSQGKAANYVLTYALNGHEKAQDIPLDWEGRKVSYSKQFFHKPVPEIWADCVEKYLSESNVSRETLNLTVQKGPLKDEVRLLRLQAILDGIEKVE